jgi:phosphatidylinositol alpha 1,6-mannosyltransferase
MENLAAHRIPRLYHWARGVDITGFAPSARDQALQRLWSSGTASTGSKLESLLSSAVFTGALYADELGTATRWPPVAACWAALGRRSATN